MDITEVRIKLMDDNGENERLQAFCSITFDNCYVVRDLKIIEGTKGSFVAMPSRKLTDRCNSCGCKNHLRARFCNSCGTKLDEDRATRDSHGRVKLHADIAHPINSGCRERIQAAVLEAFQDEKERAKLPGYVCTYDDYDCDTDFDVSYAGIVTEMARKQQQQQVNYRTDDSHETAQPAHNQEQTPQEVKDNNRQFGAGIL